MTLLTELYPAVALRQFCSVFGKNRQAWYYATRRRAEQDMTDCIVVKMVKQIREQQPRIGTRKLYHLLTGQLQSHQVKLGRDKFFALLQRYDLLIRRRRRRVITTDSRHPFHKYNNLIQDLTLTAKNQLWASDITYIALKNDFAYLSLVTDVFSRKIVGHQLWHNLSAQGTIQALNRALDRQKPQRHRLIHHSDRGVQYCCGDYVEILECNGIQISMSKKGDPYQNAIAERINGILKTEFNLGETFSSPEQATKAVNAAVTLYNSQRPHSSLSYLTPDQAHELTGILKPNWKNYRKQRCTTLQD